MKLLVTIEKKTGIPAKAVIGSLCVALVMGIVGFSYRNAELPAQKREIEEIKQTCKETNVSVSTLNLKDNQKSFELGIMKNDLKQIAKSQDDLKDDVKEIKTLIIMALRSRAGLGVDVAKN